jgi:hypothetical protein
VNFFLYKTAGILYEMDRLTWYNKIRIWYNIAGIS